MGLCLLALFFFINGQLFMQFSLMKTNLLTNGEEEIAITFFKNEIKFRPYCNALPTIMLNTASHIGGLLKISIPN